MCAVMMTTGLTKMFIPFLKPSRLNLERGGGKNIWPGTSLSLTTSAHKEGKMTTAELAKNIGKKYEFRAKGMGFPVEVIDCRMRWGKPDFQIKPVYGGGVAWVAAETLRDPGKGKYLTF